MPWIRALNYVGSKIGKLAINAGKAKNPEIPNDKEFSGKFPVDCSDFEIAGHLSFPLLRNGMALSFPKAKAIPIILKNLKPL